MTAAVFFGMDYIFTNCIQLSSEPPSGVCAIVGSFKSFFIKRTISDEQCISTTFTNDTYYETLGTPLTPVCMTGLEIFTCFMAKASKHIQRSSLG